MDSSFSRDVILTLFTRLLAGGSLAVAEIFVSSVLKVEGRGAFALFLTSQALIDALVSMGLPAAIIKTVGQKQYMPSQMATWSVMWGLGQGLVGALLFHLIALVIQPLFFQDWSSSLIYWMYLCLPSFLVAHYLSCIFLALQHSHIFNLIFLSQRILFCLFAGALYFQSAGTLNQVTGYYSLSAFASMLTACAFVLVYFQFSNRLQGLIRGCLDLYRFGSTVQIGNIFEKFALRSDIYIVNYFVPSQLGYYAVARSAADILAYFPISISLMLFPRVSQNPEATPPASTARICRLYITLQVISFLLLCYPIYWVIKRWLPEFETSIPLFLLLTPGCIGYGVFQILSLDSMGRDQNWLYARFSALFFLLVVLCDLIFLALWKVYGGAFGTGLAGVILGVMFIATYAIRHRLRGRSFFFLHRIDLQSLLLRLRQDQTPSDSYAEEIYNQPAKREPSNVPIPVFQLEEPVATVVKTTDFQEEHGVPPDLDALGERIWEDYLRPWQMRKKPQIIMDVRSKVANLIYEKTGLDVRDFKFVYGVSGMFHVKDRHTITEKHMDQLPITEEDIRKIPYILHDPDNVYYGGKTKQGLDAIFFAKKINGHLLILEEIRTGRKHLAIKTMRKLKAGAENAD